MNSTENGMKDDSPVQTLQERSKLESIKPEQKGKSCMVLSKEYELLKDLKGKFEHIEIPASENWKIFYGVCLVDGSELTLKDEDALVFCDKKEALQTVKKHSGARFKVFSTREDALNFSKSSCSTPRSADFSISDSPHIHRRAVGEKPSAFKAPRSQDMVKLRRAIECGDAEYFTKTVWSNPRYLVSCGDTPTILQEGPRYNALHVAAKFNQSAMCSLVLNTLEDCTFLPILYNDDTPQVTQQRREFITDLYLNMPDKALCETPLHFACKFGCVKVAEVLLRHPVCNAQCQNKYGKTPREIICERNGNAETRRQIESLFEALYYVPVLRSEDNSIQATVGSPYCLPRPLKMVPPSPICPSLVVKAEAGPMSLNQADLLYKKWRMSFTSFGLDSLEGGRNIRLSDSRKGLERIGRTLAHEMSVPWREYWSFLHVWTDLASAEGLQHLEAHLRNLYHSAITENSIQESEQEFCKENESSKAMSPVSLLCRQLEGLNLDSSPLNTSPDMPALFARRSYSESSCDSFENLEDALNSPDLRSRPGFLSKQQKNLNFLSSTPTTAAELSFSTHTSHHEELRHPNKTGGIYFEELCSSIVSFITFSLKNSFKIHMGHELYSVVPTFKRFLSIAHRFNEKQLSVFHNDLAKEVVSRLEDEYLPKGELLTSIACCDSWLDHENKNDDSSSDEETSVRNNCSKQVKLKKLVLIKRHLKCILSQVKDLMSDCISCEVVEKCCCSWDAFISKVKNSVDTSYKRSHSKEEDSDEFLTPPSSLVGSPLSSLGEEVFTPDEGIRIFVEGPYLSKADVDVENALEEMTVDPMLYPHINMWKLSLKSCTKEDICSLMTPQRGRRLSFNGHDHFKTGAPKSEPSRRHPISSSTPLNTVSKSEMWRPTSKREVNAQLRPKNFYDCLLNWEEVND